MLRLSEDTLDWLCELIPDHSPSAKGGRPAADKRRVVEGIFWILDNGAKWKDLPRRYGPKSTVHRWFKRWAQEGVFERLMLGCGSLVEEAGGFKLYECGVDGMFAKAKGGGDGIGCTKAGKGVKVMVIVDAQGLPAAAYTTNASPHESGLVQELFGFMVPDGLPERLLGDKAYDSDKLDGELAAQGVEMISPHRSNRRPERRTQDGRPLRRYKRRWKVERTFSWLQNYRRLCIRWEKSTVAFQGFLHLACSILLINHATSYVTLT